MTADSVPAPMVPAELKRIIAECEGAIARENVLGEQVVTVRWLKEQLEPLVDAAYPAASVPAADILALADEWDDCAYAYRQSDPLHHIYKGCANRLRALVAPAEQADKGEAADSPPVSHTNANVEGCVTCRNVRELGCMCGPNGCECPAPAAPVGEPPRCPDCGHMPHDTLDFCPNMASDNDCNCKRRVPVNDEAETVRLTGPEKREFDRQYRHALRGRIELEGLTFAPTDQLIRCVERIVADRLAGFRAARGEDA